MSNALLKAHEHTREFTTLPAVLIQHPARNCAYFLSKDDLAGFRATPEKLAGLRAGTVSFIIAGDDLVDEAPAYNLDPSNEPDVLIRFTQDRSAYLLTSSELREFEVKQPDESFGDHYVSFIIPAGMELVEEIPLIKRGLLQSNTG